MKPGHKRNLIIRDVKAATNFSLIGRFVCIEFIKKCLQLLAKKMGLTFEKPFSSTFPSVVKKSLIRGPAVQPLFYVGRTLATRRSSKRS